MDRITIEKLDKTSVVFKFTNGSLNVTIRQGDLSKEICDVIVNPTNVTMTPSGGLDTKIHQVMGKFFSDQVKSMSEAMEHNACPIGQSRIFTAKVNRDPNGARFVINTVGPIYKKDEEAQATFNLKSCYHTSLALANIYSLSSIAYPAISCGANHFPLKEAAQVAIDSVRQFSYNVQDVRFILFEPHDYEVFVQEWTDYAQKVNKEARVIDEKDRSCAPPAERLTELTNYCILCKQHELPNDRQILCVHCSKLTRSEIFNEVLQQLRFAAKVSFDNLQQECSLLKSILSDYPLTYKPTQIFNQDIHKRDNTAERYVQNHCDKHFRNLMPMAIVGDGNCFYNTFVKLTGNSTATIDASSITPVELRARNVVELVLNVKHYETKYKPLSMLLDNFQKYVREEMVHDTNFAAVWDLLSIPTVLNINVTSVYPKVNGVDDMNYQKLNDTKFIPLIINKNPTNSKQSKTDTTTTTSNQEVKILFSHCNYMAQSKTKDIIWVPNHFVPLLSLR